MDPFEDNVSEVRLRKRRVEMERRVSSAVTVIILQRKCKFWPDGGTRGEDILLPEKKESSSVELCGFFSVNISASQAIHSTFVL